MQAEKAKSIIGAGRVVAILRGDYVGWFGRIAEALAEAGVNVMEVTLNSARAEQGIREMRAALGDGFLIGAGTVLRAAEAKRAIDAGAQFIVAPNTNHGVLDYCARTDICSVPGAYTPTEIMDAVDAGATLIKLFPAELGYFKAIRAPLNHVPFVVTGGVTPDNAAEFLRAGAFGVGMGSALIGDYVKRDGGLAEMQRRARALVASLP
jgi:2-dehydro-3-deoxyphosphogluconate aldolase / (4S)-4-hydroxy-2-oxoglutarate aldolase